LKTKVIIDYFSRRSFFATVVVFISLVLVFYVLNSQNYKNLDMFVMVGQSNMQGYAGDASMYPKSSFATDFSIRFFYVEPIVKEHSVIPTITRYIDQDSTLLSSVFWREVRRLLSYIRTRHFGISSLSPSPSPQLYWSFLGPQWGRFPSGHFGPEVSFARLALRNGFQPAIFKYSKESTSLEMDWKSPGQKGLYDDFTETLCYAIADLKKSGYTVKIRGLIWVQGENDAKTKDSSRRYQARLKRIIQHLQNTVFKVKVPVVLGADEIHPAMLVHPEVKQAQDTLAFQDPCVEHSSMQGLEKADFTHLTPRALRQHGFRLYESYRKADKKCNLLR